MAAGNIGITEEIKRELDRLAAGNGGLLLVDDIIEAAKPETSVLHGCFTWDVAEAALRWWREEARTLIRSYVLEVETPPMEIKGWVHLETDRAGGYRDVREVMGVTEMRDQLLEQAKRDWKSFKAKYGRLAKLAPLVAAGDVVFSEAAGG
jgi:trehalose/maltose hydrolase-like predicted phosphorylase